MLTSRVPAVIDYLVAAFTAAATLGAAADPVTVYDGPALSGATPQLVLWVGLDDPDAEGYTVAAETDSAWAALGAQARNEQITVHCVALAWSGDRIVKTARDQAFGIVGAVETLLRADVMLGGTLVSGQCQVIVGSLRQGQSDNGAVAQVPFRIDAFSRI